MKRIIKLPRPDYILRHETLHSFLHLTICRLPFVQESNSRRQSVKRLARGFYVKVGPAELSSGGQANYFSAVKYIAPDPFCCGIMLVVPWSAVQPNSADDFDTSFIESAIEPFTQAGKKAALTCWGGTNQLGSSMRGYNIANGDTYPQFALPHWVEAQMDSSYLIPFTQNGITWNVPLCSEKNYDKYFRAYFEKVCAKYGNDTRISYIRCGLCETEEGASLCGGNNKDIVVGDWIFKPGNPATRETLDFYNNVQLPYALSKIAWLGGLASKYNANIGVGIAELSDGAPWNNTDPYRGYAGACIAEAAKYFSAGLETGNSAFGIYYPPTNKYGYEYLISQYKGSCGVIAQPGQVTESLNEYFPDLVNGALSIGATSFELYTPYFFTEDDPNYSLYSQYHTLFSDTMSRALMTMGGCN
jgi:hypothetical protein